MYSQGRNQIISSIILVIGIAASIVFGIVLDRYIKRCHGPCGRLGIQTAHERICERGHVYYSCHPSEVKKHANCTPWQDSPEIEWE